MYVDGAMLPAVDATIADASMASILSSGLAYVGFTSSTDDTARATVEVSNFTFTAFAAAGATTSLDSPPATLALGQIGSVIVRTRDQCNGRVVVGGSASSLAATLVNGEAATLVNVVDNNDGTYRLSYTPVEGGTWTLAVSWNGVPIIGSPFSISVPLPQPAVTVTGGTVTYDGFPHAASGTVTDGSGTTVGTLIFTYNGDSAAPVNAGVYAVVGTFAGSGQFAAATAPAVLTIVPATPTVTVAGASVTYARDGTCSDEQRERRWRCRDRDGDVDLQRRVATAD